MIKMIPVSTAISAAGGYVAQFADQEDAKDALEFVPGVLKNAGIRLDEAIFAKFCQRVFEKMVEHTARTGDWTTWSKVMTTRLYVLGRFESKDAKVPAENVELTVLPLEGFRLDLAGWSLQNVIEGNELKLTTVSDQGGETMGVVTGTKDVEIHGVNCPVDPAKDDEGVWLRAENKSGEKIDGLRLTVKGSDVKTVVVGNPGAALLAPYAEAKFEVRSRAGNDDGELQTKSIAAAVKAAEPVPKRRIGVNGFAASANGGETIVNFDLANAADLAGYEPQDEGAKARATFKVDGESLGEVDIYGNPFNAWHAVLPANYAGKTLEMTLTPDPAKADEVDQTPVVESATVGGEPAPEKRHVGLRDLYAYGVGESDTTVLMFGVDNAEDITGFLHGESMDSANATFKVDGEPVDGNVIEGKDGSWHATLDRNYLGKTIELTVTPDPAKADEVDQTPVSLSATVVEG